ncbi:MAG: response regulator [Verrucomicrobia bacterium]|nr:response regulator [Verrucomicrobiota bacterium]
MSDRPVSTALSPIATAGLPVEFGGLFADFWAQAPLGLCLTDAKGVIVAVNAAFCETVGYAAEELVGSSLTRLLTAEASVRGSAAHQAFIKGDDSAPAGALYMHKSGRSLFVHATDTRVNLPGGRIFRLTTLVDLGLQIQGAGQLRQHQRAENFAALASDIGNDFNNLLSIILGYTAFLQDGSLDPPRLNTAVNGIEHAVRRAANLIRQTLHLSRRDELAFQRIEVGSFVREFYRMGAETLTPGMDVVLDLEEGLPAVLLDPQHFHHALANLGQKARDLTGPGGRILFTTRWTSGEEVRARFADAREPSYVMLTLCAEPSKSVLANEENPAVWAAAVRFAEKRRDLAILVVHSIMASHRGYLEVDAMSGPALIFRLYLPALLELGKGVETAVSAEVLPAPALRTVLLVDDEESMLHSLGSALERKGFQIIKARDGIEAVDFFKANAARIALVLIDLGLPRMSGWEAFVKIKEHTPSVSAIVMSGHLEANLKNEILKAGAKGYLQKPFAMTEALAEVNRVFSTMG